MKISTRIAAGFAGMVGITLVLGTTGWLGLDRYSNQVASADRVSSVNQLVQNAQLSAARFQAHGDGVYQTEVTSRLTEARDLAMAIGQEETAATIATLEGAFGELVAAGEDAKKQTTRSKLSSRQLSAVVKEIRTFQDQRGAELQAERTAALDVQAKRSEVGKLIENLIRATLTARRDEAVFLRTRAAEDAEPVRDAMKTMFLTAVKLKRATKGTDDEKAVGLLAQSVGKYRSAFEEMAEAVATFGDTSEPQKALAANSKRIGAFGNALERKQAKAYDEATAAADQAVAEAQRAAMISEQAGALLIAVGQMEADLANVLGSDADPKAVAAFQAALGEAQTVLATLSNAIPDDESLGKLTSLM